MNGWGVSKVTPFDREAQEIKNARIRATVVMQQLIDELNEEILGLVMLAVEDNKHLNDALDLAEEVKTLTEAIKVLGDNA